MIMIITTLALTILIGLGHGQQLPSLSPYQSLASLQQQPSTTPKPAYPPAQVHYVNIGEDLAGDYKFGYDTGKNGAGQSFREETRLPDGTVKGAYGYIDAEGKQRIVKYSAGVGGFKVESDEEAPGQQSNTGRSAAAQAPAAAPVRTYSPPPRPAPAPAPVAAATPSTSSLISSAQQLNSPITITRGEPQTFTIRTIANEEPSGPVSIRYVAANDSSLYSALNGSTSSQQPAYRIITTNSPSSTDSSSASLSSSSAYPGYTTIAQTSSISQPPYLSGSTQSSGSQIISTGGTNQYSSSYPPQSATAMTLAALLARVASSSPNIRSVHSGQPLSNVIQTTQSSSSGYAAAAASPATNSPSPTSYAVLSQPSTSSSGYAAANLQSPYTSASLYSTLAGSNGAATAVASPAAGQSQAEQEATTWGPPVINKELLSYNIGVQQG